MQTVNEEQAEYWGKSASGAKWLTYEDQLDHLMSPVLELVLDRAGLQTGMRILDIGCGTGVSSIAAAKQVGESGHVLAADISEPFLDRARTRASDQELNNITFQYADAQTHDFAEDDRDAAISRFGVMFFEDSVAAFSNMARALKPGGQMTFAAWGPLADNPWFKIPHIAATSRLGHPPKVDRFAPGPLAFHDIDHVTGMMTEAGLTDVQAQAVPLGLRGIGSVRDSAILCTRVGPAARVISHFDGTSADVHAIQEGVADAFSSFENGQDLKIPAVINLFQARRST